MIVVYKPHVFSIVTKADILTENQDKILYKIKGKLFSPTAKKKIYDADGNLVFIVRDKFWHIFYKSAYIYTADKKRIACVTRKLWTFHENFFVKENENNIRIDGDLIGLKYLMFVGDRQIADISRKSFFKSGINVEDSKDLPLAIALTQAVYNVQHHRSRD